MYFENAVIQTRRLELFLEPRYIDEIGKFVGPGSAGNFRVRIEIELIRFDCKCKPSMRTRPRIP